MDRRVIGCRRGRGDLITAANKNNTRSFEEAESEAVAAGDKTAVEEERDGDEADEQRNDGEQCGR